MNRTFKKVVAATALVLLGAVGVAAVTPSHSSIVASRGAGGGGHLK